MSDANPAHAPTAVIAEYPSSSIPGIPRFVFAVPEGWVIDDAPGALCVVRQHAADNDGFWANVIIRHDTVALRSISSASLRQPG